MKWINRLYIFFLGIILSITTGFGIAAFYPQPIRPMYPTTPYKDYQTIPTSCTATPQSAQTAECQQYYTQQEAQRIENEKKQQKFDEETRVFENKNAGYTRTAVFLGIAVGAFFAILGLGMLKKSGILTTGLLLAGVLTAIFTRLLISIASLGASVNGTDGANTLGYIEFFVLLILSCAVIYVGSTTLTDDLKRDIKAK
jgi:hypothetical protein